MFKIRQTGDSSDLFCTAWVTFPAIKPSTKENNEYVCLLVLKAFSGDQSTY